MTQMAATIWSTPATAISRAWRRSTRWTDIVYVLEGTATFVTGGTAVDPKTIALNEIRGSAIEGGESRKLVKGDVIVVPHGVPHWFKEVSSPFNYYVVKVR